MLTAFLSSIVIASGVGLGFVGNPTIITPYYVCLNDPLSYANLRSEASKNSHSIARLPCGKGIRSFGFRIVGDDGLYWDFVKTADNKQGWLRDDYVCVHN